MSMTEFGLAHEQDVAERLQVSTDAVDTFPGVAGARFERADQSVFLVACVENVADQIRSGSQLIVERTGGAKPQDLVAKRPGDTDHAQPVEQQIQRLVIEGV